MSLPFTEPAQLQTFLNAIALHGETAALKQFISWVRKGGWTK